MNEIINFITTHYRLIIEVVLLVVSVLFFILRKKPVEVVETLRQQILEWLPGLIYSAEGSGLKGEDKMIYLLKSCYRLMFPKFTLSFDEFLQTYEVFIRCHVEAILTTPQKKGGK